MQGQTAVQRWSPLVRATGSENNILLACNTRTAEFFGLVTGNPTRIRPAFFRHVSLNLSLIGKRRAFIVALVALGVTTLLFRRAL
jgi:hypothetical protein